MLLAVDAGNSTIGFGLFEGEHLAVSFKAETRRATADEYWSFISSQMSRAGLDHGEVDGVVISSVVPSLVPIFFEALRGLGAAAPLLVSARLKLGLKMAYKTPESVGPDRLANAVAALSIYGGASIVVDFGSATTFSVVDEKGAFVGGPITPGLMTSYDALTSKTAGIPRVGLTYPRNVIGSSIVFGHASMVEGLIARLKAEMGGKPTVVGTGGLAGFVEPHIKGSVDVFDPQLTLKGLSIIHKLNNRP